MVGFATTISKGRCTVGPHVSLDKVLGIFFVQVHSSRQQREKVCPAQSPPSILRLDDGLLKCRSSIDPSAPVLTRCLGARTSLLIPAILPPLPPRPRRATNKECYMRRASKALLWSPSIPGGRRARAKGSATITKIWIGGAP